MITKKESDIRLIKTYPINRVHRQYISKNKSELCYDNGIPIQGIQYNTEIKHSLYTTQINLIINNIGSEWTILAKVFYEFLFEKEKVNNMEAQSLLIFVLTIRYNLYQTQVINTS